MTKKVKTNKNKIGWRIGILVLPLLIVLISLVSFVSAHISEDEGLHHEGSCMMGGMMTGVYGMGGMFFGWIVGLLVITLLILLIVWLIKQIQKK